MTMPDENHITRTSRSRVLKGLVIIIIPLILLGTYTITEWKFTASIPPPVSAPKPKPVSSETAAQSSPASKASPDTLTIPAGASTQGNPAYDPATITVKKGTVITVKNDDTAPHTATNGDGPNDANAGKLFDTSIIMPGESGTIDTSKLTAGNYPFHCTVHPYMKGTLVVQ